jgi:hypothetical protein
MRCGRGTCIWQGGLHKFLGRIEILAALLAATIHDFEHRGFNNDFLIKTQDDWVSLLPSLVLLCLSRHKTTASLSCPPSTEHASKPPHFRLTKIGTSAPLVRHTQGVHARRRNYEG